ncbi:uncharacterized protein G2W53_027069 [Senna tora]|uniref:Uncharacterized protein n=1 Tax=Senna tora TaxID=362788 RepID=A0A834WLX1_9FABA|nr:uncharacterized protein G2W53_027069 [Senna tora]
MVGQNEASDTRKPPKKFQGNPTCARPNLRWTTTWITVEGSHPRCFKAVRVGHPAVDNVGRRPSKINESWVNFISRQNLMCICGIKMKPMTQGNLPRTFNAIRLARDKILDGRRHGSPSVGDPQKEITHGLGHKETSQEVSRQIRLVPGQIFDGQRHGSPSVGDAQKSITHGKPPKKFQCDPSRSPGGRPRGSSAVKNQCVVGQLFFYAKPHVLMRNQNEAYETRKPPKKFQGEPNRSPSGRPRRSPSIKNQ